LTVLRKCQPQNREDKKDSTDTATLMTTAEGSSWLSQKKDSEHKMVRVPPSEEKKCVASKRCWVCSAHKWRKETSCMCSTCGVVLWKIPCFGEYHMNNYWTGTQKFNIIPRYIS
jgi:hypothetical protein